MPNQNEKEQPTITELARNFLNSNADIAQDVSEFSKSLKGANPKEKRVFWERLRGPAAIPVERIEISGSNLKDQAPAESVIEKESSPGFLGNSLRERRMRNSSGLSSAADQVKPSLDPMLIGNKIPQAQNAEAGATASTDTSVPEESAGHGFESPKVEPVAGHGMVQGGVAEIGSDGEIVEKGNLVDAANLGEKELAPGSQDVANIIATSESAKDNKDIAEKAFADLRPEMPAVAVVKPIQNTELAKPAEEAKQLKPEAGSIPETKSGGIVFAGKTPGNEGAIQRKVEEHVADGTAKKDKSDTLAPIITEGWAKRDVPVVDKKDIDNVIDKTVLKNQDELVAGKPLQEVPIPEVAISSTEPHPFVVDESPEISPEAGNNNIQALDKLLKNPNIPLDGQSSKTQAIETKPSEEVPVAPQAPNLEILSGDQMPSGEKSIEQPVPIQEQASATAEQEDTTKQEFWAQNAAPVATPAAPRPQVAEAAGQQETAKVTKKPWWNPFGGEQHPVNNIAYANNSHGLTAEQVNRGIGQPKEKKDVSEEPTVAKAA